MGPVRSFWWDRNVTKRKQGVYIAISVGPIAHLGGTETLRREQRDYNPISVRPRSLSVRPICLGFVVVAMTFETRWRRIERIGGAKFDFWFGHMWIRESS